MDQVGRNPQHAAQPLQCRAPAQHRPHQWYRCKRHIVARFARLGPHCREVSCGSTLTLDLRKHAIYTRVCSCRACARQRMMTPHLQHDREGTCTKPAGRRSRACLPPPRVAAAPAPPGRLESTTRGCPVKPQHRTNSGAVGQREQMMYMQQTCRQRSNSIMQACGVACACNLFRQHCDGRYFPLSGMNCVCIL